MKRFLASFFVLALAYPAMAEEYRPILNQSMPFDATSRPITAYWTGRTVQALRLICSQSCFVAFGVSEATWSTSLPLAPFASAATGLFLPANVAETVLNKGSSRIAVVALSTGGTLYVTELSK